MSLTAEEQALVEASLDGARIAMRPNGGIAAIGQQPSGWGGASNACLANTVARTGGVIAVADTWYTIADYLDLTEDVGAVNSPWRDGDGMPVTAYGALVGTTGLYMASLFMHITNAVSTELDVPDATLTAQFRGGAVLGSPEEIGPPATLYVTETVDEGWLHINFAVYLQAGEYVSLYLKATSDMTFDLEPSTISIFQIR
jgi:hypothetical protein